MFFLGEISGAHGLTYIPLIFETLPKGATASLELLRVPRDISGCGVGEWWANMDFFAKRKKGFKVGRGN